MKPTSTLVLVVVAALLSLLGQTSFAAGCGDHTNCTSCASDGGCMWALLYDCKEKCIKRNYNKPNDIKGDSAIWRSTVRNATQCPNMEWCEIMEGDVPNPSFEGWTWNEFTEKEKKKYVDGTGKATATGITVHKPWVFAKIVAVKNQSLVKSMGGNDNFAGVDGEFFLYMGGSHSTPQNQTYEVRLDETLKISEGATHLSFFYALPYYSKLFSEKSPFVNRTALDVYVDGENLLHLSNLNINETTYSETDALYHPMNIDISRFADGKKHSLMFYFTEVKNPDDYPVNGSTFDDWVEAPFGGEKTCSKYCLSKYINDGVCDMVCNVKECGYDGNDCEYDMSLSTKAIVGIVLGVTCFVIVVCIVVLLVFLRKKGVIKESGSIEMDEKPKGWSVDTKNIMFGGKEADIGIALKDTLTVSNDGKARTYTLGLIDEDRCNSDMKFKVVIKPKEFQLEKGEEQTVNIFIKIFCTTTISENLEITTKEAPREKETIKFVASGKKSTRINPYDLKIGEVVGEGSFGVVYRGIYQGKFDVAIKKLTVNDEGSIRDFNNESDILEKINSEYTVKFYGALVTDDYYCFVTEFIQFGSLSKAIPNIVQKDVNGGKRILCALNIAKGLEYLHRSNIIYRDLKPENVLVSENFINKNTPIPVVCKLTDFGTSKILDKGSENMTKAVGTPLYMGPEVITTNTYGQESDIYSFGSSFVELWLGYHPYASTNLQYFDFIKKVASGDDPLRFNPDKCYPKIHDLINACLEYKPELRPKLSEIINVLTEHWDGLKQETPVQLF